MIPSPNLNQREIDRRIFFNMNDIAIVIFEGSMPNGFGPAPLLNPNKELTKKDTIVVAGYGINVLTSAYGRLKKVTLPILKINSNEEKGEIRFSQNERSGICVGDSGGPAYIMKNGQLYLVGVSSRTGNKIISSTEVQPCIKFLISAKVSFHYDWIQGMIKALFPRG